MLLFFLQPAPLLEEVLPSVYASQRMKLSVEAKRVVVDVSFLVKFFSPSKRPSGDHLFCRGRTLH